MGEGQSDWTWQTDKRARARNAGGLQVLKIAWKWFSRDMQKGHSPASSCTMAREIHFRFLTLSDIKMINTCCVKPLSWG